MVREQVHMVSIIQGGGEVDILSSVPFFEALCSHISQESPEELFMKFEFCYSPTFSIHLHILGTSQQIKAF